MKTLLISLLLIIGALLLISFNCNAQSKESDRDWIDSLAVRYRVAFIESAMSHDEAVLDSLMTKVDFLSARQINSCERNITYDLFIAIRRYDDEKRRQYPRTSAYKKELQTTRTNFGS